MICSSMRGSAELSLAQQLFRALRTKRRASRTSLFGPGKKCACTRKPRPQSPELCASSSMPAPSISTRSDFSSRAKNRGGLLAMRFQKPRAAGPKLHLCLFHGRGLLAQPFQHTESPQGPPLRQAASSGSLLPRGAAGCARLAPGRHSWQSFPRHRCSVRQGAS